eukprot:763778-Hanusia_phi.AAC.13
MAQSEERGRERKRRRGGSNVRAGQGRAGQGRAGQGIGGNKVQQGRRYRCNLKWKWGQGSGQAIETIIKY